MVRCWIVTWEVEVQTPSTHFSYQPYNCYNIYRIFQYPWNDNINDSLVKWFQLVHKVMGLIPLTLTEFWNLTLIGNFMDSMW